MYYITDCKLLHDLRTGDTVEVFVYTVDPDPMWGFGVWMDHGGDWYMRVGEEHLYPFFRLEPLSDEDEDFL